ncbi:hypothetical protein CANCADRAFT_87834 [Tortispora caseinolytica NRRL Y-17796]|uniref:ORC6 first cyclin-like domain-containing protein n=1 Tax=Tortispora caseinolytica NRRL Y-17796 TaxID=767744 RepID=A0A1E4TLB7_9ASCO|nr:hypothetical protein CANCADRAFT_87834 [Tortispora caseinolytica NRRL Y-17796]
MNKACDDALKAMLPELNGNVPSSLTKLAVQIYAKSKLKIPNLGPSEEIARPYICARMAILHSKATNIMNLKINDGALPVSSKQFTKLYTVFQERVVRSRRSLKSIPKPGIKLDKGKKRQAELLKRRVIAAMNFNPKDAKKFQHLCDRSLPYIGVSSSIMGAALFLIKQDQSVSKSEYELKRDVLRGLEDGDPRNSKSIISDATKIENIIKQSNIDIDHVEADGLLFDRQLDEHELLLRAGSMRSWRIQKLNLK